MKIINLLLVASAAFFVASSSEAQNPGAVTNHAVAVGQGPGAAGFSSAAPGAAGRPFVSNGAASDPSFQALPNAGLSPGAANSIKGSLDGSTTSDLAIASCSALYQFTQWISGTGWRCGINPVLPSRATAATLDLSAYTSITVQGYTTAGDGGFMNMTKVGSQPFCGIFANTASFQDAGSNWWNISEAIEYNIRQFGAKQDWNGVDGSATDDTSSVQSALRCAGVQTSSGQDVGGGSGKIVRIPTGTSMISNTLSVDNGVRVVGSGTYTSVLEMKATFFTNAHFIILGTTNTQTDICASQSRGSAGNLVINGGYVRSGTAYYLTATNIAIYSASNNSGVTFAITGTDRFGAVQTENVVGPTAGGTAFSVKYWLTVTQVATNAATVGSVSVGAPQVASFGSMLTDLQLYSSNINATQITTNINQASGIISGALGNAMVYANNIQHVSGLARVKIFAGNRSATMFEQGVGGASNFIYDDVEVAWAGNAGGVASNNPGAYFNYGGLLSPVKRMVIASNNNAAGSVAVNVTGGFMHFTDFHCENTPTCIDINTTTVNAGFILIDHALGAPTVTDFIKIEAGAAANITYIGGVAGGGATHTVNNKGAFTTGNVISWTLF